MRKLKTGIIDYECKLPSAINKEAISKFTRGRFIKKEIKMQKVKSWLKAIKNTIKIIVNYPIQVWKNVCKLEKSYRLVKEALISRNNLMELTSDTQTFTEDDFLKEKEETNIEYFGIYQLGLTTEEIEKYLRARAKTYAKYKFWSTKRLYKKFVEIAGVNTMGCITCPCCKKEVIVTYRYDVKRFCDNLFFGKGLIWD